MLAHEAELNVINVKFACRLPFDERAHFLFGFLETVKKSIRYELIINSTQNISLEKIG